ncbi:MAG: alpha/beta hydrolase-fold protein [Acidobacteriota bacterium]
MPTVSAPDLRRHERFRSAMLPDARDLVVYVPPGYDESGARYPVLYLHDGQNVFEGGTAHVKGSYWRAGEAADDLTARGAIAPLIMVGIGHAGPRRIDEYTPTATRRQGGGKADAYGRMLIEEIKPFIDATYRTRPGPADTALGGSSLGGLVSLYLGLTRPDVFGRLAVLSPSVWWDRRVILRDVRSARPKPPLRIWLDMGTAEGRRAIENVRLLRNGLARAGWVEGDDLHYEEVDGAAHNEEAWAARFPRVLEWLLK